MTTKRNLLLVSLLLVFGLAASAPIALATNSTAVVSSNVYTVRLNSNADAIGSITLTFTVGGTITGGQQLIVSFGYGTWTPPVPTPYTAGYFSSPIGIVGAAGVKNAPVSDFCMDSGIGFCSHSTAAVTVSNANQYNFTLTLGVSGLPVSAGQTIEIYGLRMFAVGNCIANSGGLPTSCPPGTPVPVAPNTPIEAVVTQPINQQNFINLGGAPTSPGNVGPFEVAFVEAHPITVSLYPEQGTNYALTCKGVGTGVSLGGGSATPTFSIEVLENWAGALTSDSDELALAPYAPDATKTVTNGSDISITVSGIPVGVTVTAGTPTPCAANVGTLTFGTPSPTSFTASTGSTEATFDFPFTATTHIDLQCADYPFTVTSNGAISKNTPPIWVSVQLDPAVGPDSDEIPVPTGDYPSFSYPFTDATPTVYPQENLHPFDVLEFADCSSFLLYTYVTNYTSGIPVPFANFDTAITHSNTTSDPFTLGGAVPQNGACTDYLYYLSITSGTSLIPPVTATPAIFITPVILSGGVYGYTMSSIPAFAGLSGYVISECDFTNGTGYAQIWDNALADPHVMSSYLAYVIPNPFEYSRAKSGEKYGEFGITPVDMQRIIHNIWLATSAALAH